MDTDFREWISYSKNEFGEMSTGRWAFRRFRDIYNSFWFGFSSRYPIGMNVYESDWDALIVLDGCRVDALETVADEYEFIDHVDSIWSVGSASHEWLTKTFTNEYISDIRRTAFVVTNVFSSSLLENGDTPPGRYKTPFDIADWQTVDSKDFGYIEFLKDYFDPYTAQWDVPELRSAEYTTERAIVAGREQNFDKLVIMYYQPHRPFIVEALETGKVSEAMYYPFESYKKGDLSFDELWEKYLDNLRYGLDNVGELLENLDAEKVIITADHGELMGEFGLFGHKEGFPHPKLKKVPWVETRAADNSTINPETEVVYADNS